MLRYITIALFVTTIYSCTDEIDVNSSVDKELVLNSFISTDSIFSVEISATQYIAGKETNGFPTNLRYATINIFEDGTEKETLPFTEKTSDNKALYKSQTFYPKTDKTYRIEVSNTNYDDISCETTIPIPVQIESLDTISTKTFKLTFKDSANINNYYRLLIKTTLGKINANSETEDTIIYVTSSLDGTNIESDDPVFDEDEDTDEELIDNASEEFNIFSDDLFDGETYTLSFTYNAHYLKNSALDTDNGEFYFLTILLQSISYDEYKYLQTVALYDRDDDDELMEPVQIYSNIDSGTGIFAGYSTDSVTLEKGTYPMDGITYVYDDDE